MSGHGNRTIDGIRWSLGELEYQFVGTGPTRYQDYLDDSIPSVERWLPRVYATLAKASGSKWKTRPLCSNVESSPGGLWAFEPDPRNVNDHLEITPAHQPDCKGFHAFFRVDESNKRRAYPWLLTQWAQDLPLHALSRYSGATASSGYSGIDVGFDYPPVLFSVESQRTGSWKRPANTDWLQRGCLQIVDGRTFVIVADVDSVFWCYPIGSETDLGISLPNIPEEITKSAACPWPSWVTTTALGSDVPTSQLELLRPRWEFSNDGAKAACIAAHRDDPWSDATFTSSLYSTGGSLMNELKEDYPGLVEVSLNVAVTGPNPEDFTFSATLLQSVYSKDTGRYPLAVGYALVDMGTQIPANSLLIMEHRHYTGNFTMSATPQVTVTPISPTVTPPSGWKVPERPALAAVAVVSVQSGGSWTEVKSWLAYHCSYPTEQTYGPYPEPRPFYPRLEDIPDVPFDTDWRDNQFVFVTALSSMDLATMSFCLNATMQCYGFTPRSGGRFYWSEAIHSEVVVWNVVEMEKAVGHAFLKPLAKSALHLQSSYPDIASMTRIYPGATLDYDLHGSCTIGGADCESATLTVRDGEPSSPTTATAVLARAWMVGALASGEPPEFSTDVTYVSYASCPLFSGFKRIYVPFVYPFFDGHTMVRPGFRWTKTAFGEWEPGSASFYGYPYGAVLASRIYRITTRDTLSNICSSIMTHVSGSWSIFCGPIAALRVTGDLTDDESIDWPADYEQAVFDKVVLKHKNKVSESTHIALMNDAFGKALTESDYHLELRHVGGRPEFKAKIRYPDEIGWYKLLASPTGIQFKTEALVAMYNYTLSPFENAFYSDNFKPFGSAFAFSFPSPRLEALFVGKPGKQE